MPRTGGITEQIKWPDTYSRSTYRFSVHCGREVTFHSPMQRTSRAEEITVWSQPRGLVPTWPASQCEVLTQGARSAMQAWFCVCVCVCECAKCANVHACAYVHFCSEKRKKHWILSADASEKQFKAVSGINPSKAQLCRQHGLRSSLYFIMNMY